MGNQVGVDTNPIFCFNYETAADIDRDFEFYLERGILEESNYMMDYSWFWFLMYIWGANMRSYTDRMNEILNCGISNMVEGSKYANRDFYVKKYTPFRERMEEEVY